MRYSSDAGGMGAVMELHRDGGKVTGTWSGPLGEGRPITGPVNAFLAGWIDGDSGKGRMRVEGRSDGAWVAKRKE